MAKKILNVKLYGIHNCDKIKKAKTWLELQNINYSYVDYRKEGVSDDFLKSHIIAIGIDNLINKRGTTWRKLSEEQKTALADVDKAVRILQENVALIKRPFLISEIKNNNEYRTMLGFTPKQYLDFFNTVIV